MGVKEIENQIWLVSLLDYDLGYFDNERGRVEPGPNPFLPDIVLTMCPGKGGAPGQIRTPDHPVQTSIFNYKFVYSSRSRSGALCFDCLSLHN